MTNAIETEQALNSHDGSERGGYRMALRPAANGWKGAVLDETAAWLREKGADLDLARDVRTVIDGRSIRAMHHRNGGADAFMLSMSETNDGGQFVTTVLAVDDPDEPWLMVRVMNDRRRTVPAPRLAGRLLERTEMLDGGYRLDAKPQVIHPGDVQMLVERLADPERRGVVLVVGTGATIDPATIGPKLEFWTKNTVGLAATVVLTPDATVEFAKRTGAYHVPEGTMRTFGRGLDIGVQSAARTHRMLSPRTILDREDWQVRNLLTTFARTSLQALPLPFPLARWDRTFERLRTRGMTERIVITRPAPAGDTVVQDTAELERVRSTLGVPDLSRETLVALVEAATAPSVDQTALNEIEQQIQQLQQEKEMLQDDLSISGENEWIARQEAVEASERAAEAEQSLRRLQRILHERGMRYWDLAAESEDLAPDAPAEPGSWVDLADHVSEWETFGVLITCATQHMVDMDALDADGRALSAAYSALSALAGYVRARRCGDHEQDFGRYLEMQPPGYATYPRNKFAPTETAWTKQNYGQERKFPVPTWLDANGTCAMNAHLKLSKIPNKDPRLYFMDATHPNGDFVVVVGYLGQHLTNRATARMN